MYRTLQAVLVGVLAVVFGLSDLSRRFPDVGWLQAFRHAIPRWSAKERERARRRANVYAGAELILMGLGLPMGYVALTVMFFNGFTPVGTGLVAAGSIILVGLGVTAIWRNRQKPRGD